MWNTSLVLVIFLKLIIKFTTKNVRTEDIRNETPLVGKEFQIFDVEVTWYRANRFCSKHKMALASINSRKELRHLQMLTKKQASSFDLIISADLEGLQETNTNTCHAFTWEYVTQASEILILVFGLHLGIASRNANTQFRERQFLVASLLVEFLVSTSFYILRLVYMAELSPGEIFLALFLRSQLTNTVTVALIFLPKLWYQHHQVRSLAHDLSCRLPVDAFKGMNETSHQMVGYAGLCLGDLDSGELTISDMSSDEIRTELKRLYTQLEILKNKTLRLDNPHISKRRGGRKTAHRRFSLQKKGSKEKASQLENLRVKLRETITE